MKWLVDVDAPSTDNVTPERNNPGNAESVNQSSASSSRTEAGLEPQTVPTYSQLDNVATAQRSQYAQAIAKYKIGDEIRFFPPSYISPDEKALEHKNHLESKK